MTETAVLKSNNSTFGAIAEKYETETNNNTTETSNNNTVETSEASVNAGGEIVNNAAETNVAETVTTQEANESSLSLGFDEETSAATTQESAQINVQQEFNIDDVLKKFDRKEIAKKIGISDFALEMDEYAARGGRYDEYITAKGINWDNVSDMDLLKADFDKKYSMLSPEDREYLFNSKYSISELDDDDIKRQKAINSKIEAAQIRADKKAEQAKFKMPEAKTQQEVSKEFTEWQEALQNQQVQQEKAKQFIGNHAATQNLIQSKRVAIELGEGIKPFNFKVDKPELIMKAIYERDFWHKIISNDKGELDVAKLQRVVKYAFNPDQHDKDIFNYGKGFGHRKELEDGYNAKKPDGMSAAPDLGDGKPKITGTGKVGNHKR